MYLIESGNVAAAYGVKLAGVQVIAAYPITPQTPLTEKLSEFVDKGELDAQYIPVESEYSALSVCIAASSAGSRVFTASSANGLLYMCEQLHWAAGARLPMVMCVANRAVGAPWTIWNDHQDSISQRDAGWIQLYASDHQQIIDTVIQGFYLTEKVKIPIMVCYDGYILSHTIMPFEVPESIHKFLPSFEPDYDLDPQKPTNVNTVTFPDMRVDVRGELAAGYFQIRHNLQEDLRRSIDVVQEADSKFLEVFGRGGSPFFEEYRCQDAEFVVICLGSLARQFWDVVDLMREEGILLGVLGLRLYRPFPDKEIIKVLSKAKGVLVFEKAISYGYEGALYADVKAALYHQDIRPFVHNYILGLGGKEIWKWELIEAVKRSCSEQESLNDNPQWID